MKGSNKEKLIEMLDERSAAIELGTSVTAVRIECRVKKRLTACGSSAGVLLFHPAEIKRFKKEVVPVIRGEQKMRIKAGSMTTIRKLHRGGLISKSDNSEFTEQLE